MKQTVLLGSLLDCVANPAFEGDKAIRFVEDGGLLLEQGIIKARGARSDILAQANEDAEQIDHSGYFLVPGFIDTHVHYPQTEMVAAYGEQLLTWLTEHAFPTEMQYTDKVHAREVADVFLTELLRNGTTTALVFGTVHPQSVEAFFESAQQKGLRMICGKVMMDRNCPDELQDTVVTSYIDSKALIDKWHGVDRLQYALTPRFAPTSTPEQLAACQQLMQEYPDVYMHTHSSENKDECAWVAELFPESSDYVGVYEDAGLLRKRSILAHGIHLNERELNCIAEHEAAVAHCPTSNMFIGSGLFNIQAMNEHNINVGLGTDIGAGTSFSLLQTYNEAYKVQQLRNEKMSAFEGFYLATLGGARALDLVGRIGKLEVGCEADIAILDLAATPFMEFRLRNVTDLHDKLFALMMLGDDRAVKATYANGTCVHQR
ncbi:MAG: guanine deaminase [Reinekea sp.]